MAQPASDRTFDLGCQEPGDLGDGLRGSPSSTAVGLVDHLIKIMAGLPPDLTSSTGYRARSMALTIAAV
jgi:hypothetical protein